MLAAAERVQVRHLRPSVPTLETCSLTRSESRKGRRRTGPIPIAYSRSRLPGYGGDRARGRAWLVIGRTGIRAMLGNRRWIVLMVAVVDPVSGARPSSFILPPISPGRDAQPDRREFRDFFDKQDIFVFIMTVTLGSSLIAQDRRANALQIYL